MKIFTGRLLSAMAYPVTYSRFLRDSTRGRRTCGVLAGLAIGVLPSFSRAADSDVVAVYASVSPDYHRVRTGSGKFGVETYAFGKGGFNPGAINDAELDHMSFLDVARLIAPALASQNYLPCDHFHPDRADLLIVVYWGATVGTDQTSRGGEYQIAQAMIPPPMPPPSPTPDGNYASGMASDPSMSGRQQEFAMRAAEADANESRLDESLALTGMANEARDKQDVRNATVLGYLGELNRMRGLEGTPLESRRRDVVEDIEEGRYYVVLLAYDFQLLYRHKQRKLLWEARYSVPERRNDFQKALARMSQSASRYFGQDSKGLLRHPIPEGKVIIGPTRVMGEVESPSETESTGR